MKLLCTFFGCKYIVTETATNWSTSCKRCGQGYGHGIIRNDNDVKIYSAKMAEQHNAITTIIFPAGEECEVITTGGGGGGGCGAVDHKMIKEFSFKPTDKYHDTSNYCTQCLGVGIVRYMMNSMLSINTTEKVIDCPKCNGTGRKNE